MSERENFDYEVDFEETLEQEDGNMVLRLARFAEKYLGFRSAVIVWSVNIILWCHLGTEKLKSLLASQELERAQQEWIQEQFSFRAESGLSREQKFKKLRELFGNYADMAFRADIEKRKGFQKEKEDIEITGLRSDSNYESLPAEAFRQIIEQTYPKGWINDISSVSQSRERVGILKAYNIQDERGATATFYTDSERIVFHEASFGESLYSILLAFAHESGHANDHQSDNEMTLDERVDLLLALADRLSSEDRFPSDYVESINNEDKQLELYAKALEYYAEICEAYFSYPTALHYLDFALVHERVRKLDPNFEPLHALNDRNQLLFRLVVSSKVSNSS